MNPNLHCTSMKSYKNTYMFGCRELWPPWCLMLTDKCLTFTARSHAAHNFLFLSGWSLMLTKNQVEVLVTCLPLYIFLIQTQIVGFLVVYLRSKLRSALLIIWTQLIICSSFPRSLKTAPLCPLLSLNLNVISIRWILLHRMQVSKGCIAWWLDLDLSPLDQVVLVFGLLLAL